MQKEFSNIFKKLRNLGMDITIKLKQNTMPYGIYSPCHIAILLRPQVGEEHRRLGSNRVIINKMMSHLMITGIVAVQ